jgi:lipopolysaccharide/colanic/teichoic acid biosynthesis glycosyltransferase
VAQRKFQRIFSINPRTRRKECAGDPLLHSTAEMIRRQLLPRNRQTEVELARVPRFTLPRTAPDFSLFTRRAFDAISAAAGLALLAPLFATIALAIKLDDGGAVFYSHFRVGKGLREFRLLKFRTMISGPTDGSTVTAPQDARVTRVGRFLRKYKLDELPQLVNVLRGEMQLVGARPQMEKFVEMFREEYEELLQDTPGITDLASLSFRNEAQFFHRGSIEQQYINRIMPAKLRMSLKYARTRTFQSDLKIIFRTVLGLPSPSTAWEDARFDPPVQWLSKFLSRNSL